MFQKLKELHKLNPLFVEIAMYFSATYVGTGAIAWNFNLATADTLFMALIASLSAGVVAVVKNIDKKNESE